MFVLAAVVPHKCVGEAYAAETRHARQVGFDQYFGYGRAETPKDAVFLNRDHDRATRRLLPQALRIQRLYCGHVHYGCLHILCFQQV